MIFNNVVIRACGHALPSTSITSDEIEQDLAPIYEGLGLPFGRLELMSGIKARRYWEAGTAPSSLSTSAARALFEKNPQIDRAEIDQLIHASVCRDFLEPATASVVHEQLNLGPDCEFFDLSNACLGVMSATLQAARLIEAGMARQVLVVSGENAGPLYEMTKRVLLEKFHQGELTRKNIKPYFANLTIGSAAVAFLVSHKDFAPSATRFLGGALMSDSAANKLCRGSGDTMNLMMETNSEELLKHGIALAKKTWRKTIDTLALTPESIDYVVGHQVGSAHEKLTLEAMELEHHKTFRTYDELGNTGSAALPITYMKLIESGAVAQGEKIALLGIGSGLSSLMCVFEKGKN